MKFVISLIFACAALVVAMGATDSGEKQLLSQEAFNIKTARVRAYFEPIKKQVLAAVAAVVPREEIVAAAGSALSETGTAISAGPTLSPSAAPTPSHEPTHASAVSTTTAPVSSLVSDAPSTAPTAMKPVKEGFLTIIQGTATGCMPVTGLVRVQLGVCAESGNIKGFYTLNYVQPTEINGHWYQDTFSDGACATTPIKSTLMATVDRLGCGKLHVTGASQNLLVDGSYATVTLDTGFDGVPASSSVPTSWGFTAAWATADACAHPNAYAPILLVGKPLAPKAKCPPTAGCTAMTLANPNAAFGASTTAGCSTITPTAAGYMTLTQWAGGKPGQCTGSIANVTTVVSLGQCLATTALPNFSPVGVSKGYYRFSAVAQSLPVTTSLQLTEYSDAKCAKPVATEIVFSLPWSGCLSGLLVTTLAATATNPCTAFRQASLVSSTKGNPALPLLPGTWDVFSTYATAAGCTDKAKKTGPLYCSATLGTDKSHKCSAAACTALPEFAFGTAAAGTCLKVTTKKSAVATVIEAAEEAFGLRGSTAADSAWV